MDVFRVHHIKSDKAITNSKPCDASKFRKKKNVGNGKCKKSKTKDQKKYQQQKQNFLPFLRKKWLLNQKEKMDVLKSSDENQVSNLERPKAIQTL